MNVIHRIEKEGTFFYILNAFLGAYNRRTDVIARQASGGDTQKLDAILKNQTTITDMLSPLGGVPATIGLIDKRSTTIHGLIFDLKGILETMSSNIDRIEKEAADAAENVGLVRTAVEELKATSEAMKTEIAALKEQVAKGQLDQARLDAAASVFEKADEDIDAIVLPGTPAPEGGGGTEG